MTPEHGATCQCLLCGPMSGPVPERRRISITIDAETEAWLRAQAAADGCSLGDMVEGCVLAVRAADGDLQMSEVLENLVRLGLLQQRVE